MKPAGKQFWTIKQLAAAIGEKYAKVWRWVELGYVESNVITRQIRGKKPRRFYRIPDQVAKKAIEDCASGLMVRRP